MKKSSSYINTILFIFLILLVVCYFGIFKFMSKEAFESKINSNNRLSPGQYPKSQDELLLRGYYNIKENTNVTKNNNYNIWKEYPVYTNSYKKETNNKDFEVIVEIFVGEKNIVKIPFEDENIAIRFCDVNFPNVNLKI